MVYDAHAPYEILQTSAVDFQAMQRLRRFSRYWDLVANSGNLVETAPLIWGGRSPFWSFLEFSDWLYERVGRTHAIALRRLFEIVREYLITQRSVPGDRVDETMTRDYQRGGRTDLPWFLRPGVEVRKKRDRGPVTIPRRQARHRPRTEDES